MIEPISSFPFCSLAQVTLSVRAEGVVVLHAMQPRCGLPAWITRSGDDVDEKSWIPDPMQDICTQGLGCLPTGHVASLQYSHAHGGLLRDLREAI